MKKIYLDYNATTPVDPEVLEAMLPCFQERFGNPSSVHSEGRAARVRLDEAREQVAGLIGAQPGEIVFTSGGTESNNFAILGAALGIKNRNRHIITCAIEHPSVLRPCEQLRELGFQVDRLPVDRMGRVDLNQLEAAITDSTLLVSIQHANSEVGTLQDIERIGEVARGRGALFHTDAVQSAGKVSLDVNKLPVDFLSVSAHKLYGPKGVGALFIRKNSPALFSPIRGGNQEKKRRGGTENVPGIVGFGKACELAKKRLDTDAPEQLGKLRQRLLEGIKNAVPDMESFGDPEHCLPNTLNIGFAGVDGETLLIGLDMDGIAVSTGSACSSGSGLPSHVLTAMGISSELVNASIRFSLGWANSPEDIDRVVGCLVKLIAHNRKKNAIIS